MRTGLPQQHAIQPTHLARSWRGVTCFHDNHLAIQMGPDAIGHQPELNAVRNGAVERLNALLNRLYADATYRLLQSVGEKVKSGGNSDILSCGQTQCG